MLSGLPFVNHGTASGAAGRNDKHTIEAAYGLPPDGQAATARPITDVWAR
jgi:hypothetical protein